MTAIEAILRRDRSIILTGLVIITLVAWVYMAYLARSMTGMDMSGMDMSSSMAMSHSDMGMPMAMSWSTLDLIMTFVMWAVMMVAMMVPAAAPMVLIFANMNRKRMEQQQPFVPTLIFLSGYLVVWWGFALLATTAQWGLHQAALLSSMMGKITPLLGGVILVSAGIFQWTPLKNVCLEHCRGPIGFMMSHWREGRVGTLYMGMNHGFYCLGCCWFLMGLMFVAGVMNLLWMAGIAAFILFEKVVPSNAFGRVVVYGAGLLMIVLGVWMIAEGPL